jgi:exosortase D (VPLPA-CTERM-specific)
MRSPFCNRFFIRPMDSLHKNNIVLYASFCLIALLLGFMFSDALAYMLRAWESEEYSHGYLIPVISAWFIWCNREQAKALLGQGSWLGLILVMLGLLLGLMGELATLYIVTQYAFLLVLYGLCLSLVGWRGVNLLWFALAYLFFMIPLPSFLYNNLSSQLQLISSQLGVAVIRALDISVFLQGNVIDLGSYQLQVVEACSGLRYLFPLTSFGFLCAFFFRTKWWIRTVVFLTTLPITVLMNSFRIGVIGILVEYWGIEQAEGFLHDFEGWIVFIGCLGILFTEMWLLVRIFMPGKKFGEVFVVDAVVPQQKSENPIHYAQSTWLWFGLSRSYWITLVLLIAIAPATVALGDREEAVPERQRFTIFPLSINGWKGSEVGMEQKFIDTLKFDDYIVANYARSGDRLPVNFYVAYYASQRKGASAHSPKSCMPGDGWRIGEFEQRTIGSHTTAKGDRLRVNRAVISKGKSRQLVYYWFQQRGRVITNEYLVKWYLFWDALTQQRTDGALVRLVVSLPENMSEQQADNKMEQFLGVFFPELEKFIPS